LGPYLVFFWSRTILVEDPKWEPYNPRDKQHTKKFLFFKIFDTHKIPLHSLSTLYLSLPLKFPPIFTHPLPMTSERRVYEAKRNAVATL